MVASDPKDTRNIFAAGFLLDQFEIVDDKLKPFPRTSSFDPATFQISIEVIETPTDLRFGLLKDFEVELDRNASENSEILDTYPIEKSSENILTLLWQPAFCESMPTRPECTDLNNPPKRLLPASFPFMAFGLSQRKALIAASQKSFNGRIFQEHGTTFRKYFLV